MHTLDAEFLAIVSHWPQAFSYEGILSEIAFPPRLIQPTPLSNIDGEPLAKNPDGSYETTDEVNFNNTWAEIEKRLDTWKIRAIGVRNFSIKMCVSISFFFRFFLTFVVASCQRRETFHDGESDASG